MINNEELDEDNKDYLYGPSFQQSCIHLLATDVRFAIDYGIYLKEHHFSNESLRIIFGVVREHVAGYEQEMDLDAVKVGLENYSSNAGLTSELLKTLRRDARAIFSKNIRNQQFIIDSVLKFVRRQELTQALLKSVEIMENGEDYERVLHEIDKAVSVGSGRDDGFSFDNFSTLPEDYLVKYDPATLVSTGFPALDKAMMGGMAPGEVHVIVAPPKTGKSTIGVCVGGHNLKLGKNVFDARLEISKLDTAMKYGMYLTEMKQPDIIANPELYRQKMSQYSQIRPNLHINHWPENTVTTHEIRAWISRVRAAKSVDPDLIIVDYDDPLHGDTLVPLLDGTEVPIKDLVGKDEFWLYASKEDGEVVPGRGHSARVARHVNELVEIELDNGEVVKSTINHNHMLRDGSFKRADELKVGDSMMPFYTRDDVKSPSGKYLEVWDNKESKYKTWHRKVLESVNHDVSIEGLDVHHKNGNTRDNRPENLEMLSKSEHLKEGWKNEEFASKVTSKAKKQWEDPNFRELVTKNSNSKEIKERVCKSCGKLMETTVGGLISHTRECESGDSLEKEVHTCRFCKLDIKTTKKTFKTHEVRCRTRLIEQKEAYGKYLKDIKDGSYEGTWRSYKEKGLNFNHKIVSIRKIQLEKPEPVYCLTVDDFHNYALSAGIFTHNCLLPSAGVSKDDSYGDAGKVYSDLIKLGDYFQCPILTFAQPQREAWNFADNKQLITHQHLAHSAKKAHKAHSISTLNFGDSSPTGTFYLDINRRGESKVKFRIQRRLDISWMYQIA